MWRCSAWSHPFQHHSENILSEKKSAQQPFWWDSIILWISWVGFFFFGGGRFFAIQAPEAASGVHLTLKLHLTLRLTNRTEVIVLIGYLRQQPQRDPHETHGACFLPLSLHSHLWAWASQDWKCPHGCDGIQTYDLLNATTTWDVHHNKRWLVRAVWKMCMNGWICKIGTHFEILRYTRSWSWSSYIIIIIHFLTTITLVDWV